MQIVWTEPALRDLASLRTYITRDNPVAAEGQVERILRAVAGLAHFPDAGRVGRHEGTRELMVGKTPYLVPYRIHGNRLEILRVLHGRQRWPDA